MKVLVEGHRYLANCFENKEEGVLIQFIHKEPSHEFASDLVTKSDGTTNEEILRILIDRLKYLNSKFSCRENAIVITKLEEALMWLEYRTAERMKRHVEGKAEK